MTENEKILRGLSLIAAELHIQNYISVAAQEGAKVDRSFVSENLIEEIADYFKGYFGGEIFSPGAVMGYKLRF
jgi:hypothetical protein